MNILTIDFDWIMSPVIEAYNNFVDEDDWKTRNLCWEEIHRVLPGMNFFPDLSLFDNVIEICEKYQDRLYKINSHEEVIPYCKGADVVVNIDHHHDWYGTQLIREPNCADWARYLWDTKKIKQYIWIANPTSNSFPFFKFDIPKDGVIVINGDPFFTLSKFNFDKIILCKSEYWLSDEALSLWNILIRRFDFINEK